MNREQLGREASGPPLPINMSIISADQPLGGVIDLDGPASLRAPWRRLSLLDGRRSLQKASWPTRLLVSEVGRKRTSPVTTSRVRDMPRDSLALPEPAKSASRNAIILPKTFVLAGVPPEAADVTLCREPEAVDVSR